MTHSTGRTLEAIKEQERERKIIEEADTFDTGDIASPKGSDRIGFVIDINMYGPGYKVHLKDGAIEDYHRWNMVHPFKNSSYRFNIGEVVASYYSEEACWGRGKKSNDSISGLGIVLSDLYKEYYKVKIVRFWQGTHCDSFVESMKFYNLLKVNDKKRIQRFKQKLEEMNNYVNVLLTKTELERILGKNIDTSLEQKLTKAYNSNRI